MELHIQETITDTQKVEITALWNSEFPSLLAFEAVSDFEGFLQKSTNHLHIIYANKHIQGWMMVFERNADTWFSIIISPEAQGKGLGRLLLHEAKKHVDVLNGWVVDVDTYETASGKPYTSPIAFYLKNGFEVLEGKIAPNNLFAVQIRWKRE